MMRSALVSESSFAREASETNNEYALRMMNYDRQMTIEEVKIGDIQA